MISVSKTYEILMPTGSTAKKYTASVNETTDIVLKVCYDEGKPQFQEKNHVASHKREGILYMALKKELVTHLLLTQLGILAGHLESCLSSTFQH